MAKIDSNEDFRESMNAVGVARLTLPRREGVRPEDPRDDHVDGNRDRLHHQLEGLSGFTLLKALGLGPELRSAVTDVGLLEDAVQHGQP